VHRSRDRRRAAELEGHILAAVGRRVPGYAEVGHREVVGRERGILLEAEGRAHGTRRVVVEGEHRMRRAAGEGDRSLVEMGIGLAAAEHQEVHHMAVEDREAVDSLGEDQVVHREEAVHMRHKAALWSSQQSPRSSQFAVREQVTHGSGDIDKTWGDVLK